MNKFTMLVGPAGSGKSTYAQDLCNQNNNCIIVSSDSIRQELFGDESVQGDPNEVFSLCKTRCIEALKEEKDVILDATNLVRKRRKSFLNDIKNRAGISFTSVCIVVASTYEDCIAHNLDRERQVPEEVIHKHFCQFQMPLYSEGWDVIDSVTNSNVSLQQMLDKCKGLEHDNHHHKYNVYDHISQTEFWIARNMEGSSPDFTLLRQLSLWHDVGKVYTKVFEDKEGNATEEAHFYSHEAWSSMYSLCDNSYSQLFKIKLAQLISLHMMKYQPEYDTFISNWAPEYKDLLDIFNKADAESA